MKDKAAGERSTAGDGAERNSPKLAIKTSGIWEFVYLYLEVLRYLGVNCGDKEFYRLFGRLEDYVYGKIKLPECEVLDEYYVYEVKFNDSKTEAGKNREYKEGVEEYFRWIKH